ncbi:rod shape-determining protein MreC [Campylobacter corcagiensis]|uniref:Rod shape-determining protein MreC n=1 Tax=Campylobacter corcagiensis TaxID=1448857 RepID=A0A7M1LH37_9BACT|nr:rod shape-determining protein MreC [Campylobacter corcagiensis]QKF64038.1 rod shape-determining protein MreC [Campylobacter corcagiensis]QOQ87760.1 rod shape-determining protein MreC [Campylobacter corcagiensis]
MSKIKPLIFIAILVFVSLYFGSAIQSKSVGVSSQVVSFFKDVKDIISFKITQHIHKNRQVRELTAENKELEKRALLLNTFAYELNQILKDTNSLQFSPNAVLIRTTSYVNISDYSKFWVDFKGFKDGEIYGVIYGGNSAGIVVSKDNNPMLVLQNDPLSSFSVSIGFDEIPAVAVGDGVNLIAKFIPQWLSPNVGDEVFTSGLDEIFFAGVPVGVVKEVIDEDLYKSAVIEPYFKENSPAFLYAVTKVR